MINKTAGLFLLLFTVPLAQASANDFQIDIVGGKTVMQGTQLNFTLQNELLSGSFPNEGVTYEFIDQDSGQSLPYGGIDFDCPGDLVNGFRPENGQCWGTYPHFSDNDIGSLDNAPAWIQLKVSPQAALGKHVILVRGTTPITHTVRTTPIEINVLSQAQMTLTQSPFPPPVVIPQLARWQSDMTSWGAHWCDRSTPLDVIDRNVIFYDGSRVFAQIEDYTQDPKWEACRRWTADWYNAYVSNLNGTPQGYFVFTKGLRIDSERSGTGLSSVNVNLLASHNWYGTAVHTSSVEVMREAAFGLQAHLDNYAITKTMPPHMQALAEMLMGQLDQIFIQKKFTYVQPFMVGLAMEALIQYYNEVDKDPRIPYMIKKTADGLWDLAWKPEGNGFAYRCYMDGCYTPTPDLPAYPVASNAVLNYNNATPPLNNLIAPAYAWLFLQTGDPLYRERGDSIFANGEAHGDVTFYGKEFSQNYRWTFDYVQWRSLANEKGAGLLNDTEHPDVRVVTPRPNQTVSTSTVIMAEAADNLYVTAVQFKIDGLNAGAPITERPFETALVISLYANGPHTITAVAYDAAGNSAESAPFTFQIANLINTALDVCPSTNLPTDMFQGCYYQHGYTPTYLNDMYYDIYGRDLPVPANLGTLKVTRMDPAIHFDWSFASPAPGVDPGFFAVVWQGNFALESGAYTFTLTKDTLTGMRLYLDGEEEFEGWDAVHSPTTSSVTIVLPYTQTHLIRVELWRSFTNTGDSIFHPFDVSWVKNPLPVPVIQPSRPPFQLPPVTSSPLSGPPPGTSVTAPSTFHPRVYPNPWRADKHAGRDITFDALSAGSTIKLYTTSGHLVKELTSGGSSMTWERTNDKGDKVASGIYVYVITDTQGNKAKGKLAVVK